MARQRTNLAASASVVRTPRVSLKRTLKPGSETARQEGETARAEAKRLLNETIAKQAAEATKAQQDKITSLRQQLGIDDLLGSFKNQMAQYQQDLPEITKIKRIPMPSELIEQFNRNIINRKN